MGNYGKYKTKIELLRSDGEPEACMTTWISTTARLALKVFKATGIVVDIDTFLKEGGSITIKLEKSKNA